MGYRGMMESSKGSPFNKMEQAEKLLAKPPTAMPMARELYDRPHAAPRFLKVFYANRAFKIFEVEDTLR